MFPATSPEPPAFRFEFEGARVGQVRAGGAPLFGFPKFDEMARKKVQRRSCDAATKPTSVSPTKMQRARTPSTPPLPTTDAPTRAPNSPLDSLGPDGRASYDEIGHLRASLSSLLPPPMLRLINLPDSMRKLDTVVAQDMRRAIHSAFKNGVRHGEWLKAADAERAKEGCGVDLATHTQLQLRYSLLQESHVSALAELEQFKGAPVVQATASSSSAPHLPGLDIEDAFNELMSEPSDLVQAHFQELVGDVQWILDDEDEG